MKTILNSVILLSILLIGVTIIGVYWTFYKPLPTYNEEIISEKLNEDVKIYWDDYKVPHIEAQNLSDLYFTIGYLHAQDRLWQMTLVQMAAEGRFSEYFGSEVLFLDKYQRTIGFWRMAKKIEQTLSDDELSSLKAYSSGVNEWISKNADKYPIEFALAEMEPIPWTITHSIALVRLLGWDLNVSWWPEIAYSELASKLNPDQLKSIYPEWNPEDPHSMTFDELKKSGVVLSELLNLESERRKLFKIEGTHVGSNAWVIGGDKTDSGYPLLAGDPHLGFSIPGKWYEIHASVNGRELSGATHPGAPIIIVGQNDFAAWSLTNIMADDTDFFLGKFHPQDKGQYLSHYKNGEPIYKKFEYDRSYIKQKDGSEAVSEIKLTNQGVVVSDILDRRIVADSLFISMKWTGHQVSNEYGVLYDINWSSSFDEVKAAVPRFDVPGQNLMYADKTGNYAMFSMGKLPIRDFNPISLPNGWDYSEVWTTWIPKDEMPRVINPEKGWIANANNKPVKGDYPHYLATFYEPPSRINRIIEKLTSKKLLNKQDFKDLQYDSYSYHSKSIVELILPILNKNLDFEEIKTAHTYLSNWDFKYSKSSTAASIFDVFFTNLYPSILQDEVGTDLMKNLTQLENVPVRTVKNLITNESDLFDNTTTIEVETIDDIVIATMLKSIAFLKNNYGVEPYNWRWENLHTLTLEAPVFSIAAKQENAPFALKILVDNILNRGPFPVVGHGLTVNNTQYDWDGNFEVVLGASIRRIVDLSDLRSTLSVIPGGQSGRPTSAHYDDQVKMWIDGNYKELIQDLSLVKNQEKWDLTLMKAKN